MILFKSIYKQAILNETKTTTMRVWKRNRCKAGTICKTNIGINLFIDSVETIAISDITDQMALADGFDSSQELITCLHETYTRLPDVLTLIKFHIA